MNNRDNRRFVKGAAWHIFNRGVGKMKIFHNADDYLFFLRRVKETLYPETVIMKGRKYRPKLLPTGAFDLLLYCLMPNHFHFAAIQNSDIPISEAISKICTSYSKYFNQKYERVGAVFQDQFKAVLVENNEQLLWLTAYIHLNPLKAGLVGDLTKYPYSSHLDYLGLRNGTLCKKDLIINQFKSVDDYKKAIFNFNGELVPCDLMLDNEN